MSTFRADFTAHLMTIGRAYRTAHPGLLRKVFSARPGAFGDVPCMFLGDRAETSPDDDTGTVTRNLTVEVVLVDVFGDNEQTEDRLDVLVDGLATAFRSASNTAVGGGIIDAVDSILGGDITVTNPNTGASIFYRSASIAVRGHIQEGRT